MAEISGPRDTVLLVLYLYDISLLSNAKCKGKLIPITGLCGLEGEERYSFTLHRPRL